MIEAALTALSRLFSNRHRTAFGGLPGLRHGLSFKLHAVRFSTFRVGSLPQTSEFADPFPSEMQGVFDR